MTLVTGATSKVGRHVVGESITHVNQIQAEGAAIGRAKRARRQLPLTEGTMTVRSVTMNVMAIGHLTGKDIGPYLEAEGRRVAELRNEGLIRDVFLKADRTGPILLLNDTTTDKARKQLADLPFVEHGLVAFEYIELNDLPSA